MKKKNKGLTCLAILMMSFNALRLIALVPSVMDFVASLNGAAPVDIKQLVMLVVTALLALFSLVVAAIVLARRAQKFCSKALVFIFVLGIVLLVITFVDSEVWMTLLDATLNVVLPGLLYAAMADSDDQKLLSRHR